MVNLCKICYKPIIKIGVDGFYNGPQLECYRCSSGYKIFGCKSTKEPQLLLGCEVELELPTNDGEYEQFDWDYDYDDPYDERLKTELEDYIDYHDKNRFYQLSGDGSLAFGVEIKTSPATFWYLKESKELNILWELPNKFGARSYRTTTCGMHIHMNTAALGTLSLYKMINFVLSNTAFCKKVSQRKQEKLDKWSNISPNLYTTFFEKLIYAKKNKTDFRMGPEFFNYPVFRQHAYSTECRLFRGTLSEAGFWRNVEFCHSLFSYCRETSVQSYTNLDKYLAYVSKHNYYKNLDKFLATHWS